MTENNVRVVPDQDHSLGDMATLLLAGAEALELDPGVVVLRTDRAQREFEVPREVAEKAEVPFEDPAAEEDEGDEEPSLDWTRDQLDEHARGLEIEDPDKLPNKQAVLDAINEKKDGDS